MPRLHNYREFIEETRYDSSHSKAIETLWAAQEAMLEFALSRNEVLLWGEVSTGKTFFAMVYLEYFTGLRIIVSPSKPMANYPIDYADKYPADDKPYSLYVIDKTIGTLKERAAHLDLIYRTDDNAVVVINYELSAFVDWTKYAISAVVCDEGHRLAAWDGKQSIHLARTMAHVKNKVVMTGTPTNDGYERLYGICRWLNPLLPSNARAYPQARIFGHYNDFLDNFCITYAKGYARIIKGYKNKDKLAELITPFTLIIKTTDVMTLPDAVEKVYDVPLNDATAIAYRSLEENSAIELDDSFVVAPHVLTKIIRLQQLITSGILEDEEGNEKRFSVKSRKDKLVEILTTLGDNEPVVIFTKYRRDVEIIADLCRCIAREDIARLTGDVNDYLAWKSGEYRILVANLAAGSEGVRLERAKHAIWWSVGHSLKQFVQSRGRIRRNGQKSNTVYFHYLVSPGTIDEEIYKILARKAREVDEIDSKIK
jgi:SNF2 family DNA or RNA helicase